MITLVVKEPGQNDKAFEYRGSILVIGRSEDSGLMLPNVSVSRRHACIKATSRGVILEDLFSENGIVVNGVTSKRHELSPGDTFRVGRYGVVFLGVDLTSPEHGGKALDEMPRFHPRETKAIQEATYRFTPDMVKKFLASSRLSKGGALVATVGQETVWMLGEGSHTVGRTGASIEAKGFFWGAIAAEVRWTGTAHRIKKLTPFGILKVNNRKLIERQLKEGDEVQIGRTRFRYIVKE
jgi:pSer/pThr/pTyr-binding forkhead associated (FHA) protein